MWGLAHEYTKAHRAQSHEQRLEAEQRRYLARSRAADRATRQSRRGRGS